MNLFESSNFLLFFSRFFKIPFFFHFFFVLILLTFLFVPLCSYQLPDRDVDLFFTPSTVEDNRGAYVRLTNFIDQATNSIYGALHELDLISVAELLKKKSAQGVYVELLLEERWLTELDNLAAYQILKSAKNIKVIPDYRKSGLMHNKYLIVDKKYLWTGSANWTFNGFFRNYNDGLLIAHPDIVKQYYKNYLHLANPYFKKRLNKNIYPQVVKLKNKQKITPLFSRFGYSVTERINLALSQSKREVKFLIFAFSSQSISQQLIKELENGLNVQGVFDNSFESENILKNWKYVPFQGLWQAGANVKYDNEKAKVHHKVFILDKNKVLTGSFNFSKNAEKNNNENLIVLESTKINSLYQKRFVSLWQRFPAETDFEKYTKLKNKKKIEFSFGRYQKQQFKKKEKIFQKELSQNLFAAQIINVVSSSQFVVRLPQSQKTILIRLYGCLSPFRGNHKLHQEPQFTITRQRVALPLIQKNIFFKYLYKHQEEYICLGFLNKADNKKYQKTINIQQIKNGLVLANQKDAEIALDVLEEGRQVNFSQSEWKIFSPLFAKILLKSSSLAKRLKVGLYSKELALAKHPEKMAADLENLKIELATLENKHSLSEYKRGCYIGNRKTLKCYSARHPNYLNYLKNLADSKLIFFATKEAVKLCGYRMMW